jgi:hypothetical protein
LTNWNGPAGCSTRSCGSSALPKRETGYERDCMATATISPAVYRAFFFFSPYDHFAYFQEAVFL